MQSSQQMLSWFGIIRLGLVQTALGAVVVLTTSTLNRVMVVELALPAMLPGFLVGLHYAIQVLRPRLGFGSDVGGRRSPWIMGGMAVLACGGALAAVATALMSAQFVLGLALAIAAFIMIGLGVGAAGTSLLVLLAKRTDPARRSAAASVAWIMMILGFIVTTASAGYALEPFSTSRLIAISSAVSGISMILTLLGIWKVEEAAEAPHDRASVSRRFSFHKSLAEVWSEPAARHLTIFIFVSMLAYSAQDLILEPFAGAVFGMTPGETTRLSGVQHGGALIGMITVPAVNAVMPAWRLRTTAWIIGGCVASALALLGLALAAIIGPAWPLPASVLALGITNGIYAIAAIGAMMDLVGAGHHDREGTRMGLWGASQAISFGLGGFMGTMASDSARWILSSISLSYALVFTAEAGLFLIAAYLAIWIGRPATGTSTAQLATSPANQGA